MMPSTKTIETGRLGDHCAQLIASASNCAKYLERATGRVHAGSLCNLLLSVRLSLRRHAVFANSRDQSQPAGGLVVQICVRRSAFSRAERPLSLVAAIT